MGFNPAVLLFGSALQVVAVVYSPWVWIAFVIYAMLVGGRYDTTP